MIESRDGRQSALIAFWDAVTESGSFRSGSAGLGFYQIDSLRFRSRLYSLPSKAADPRTLLPVDVGYFPPNTLSDE
jgi:hypothetical protein